MDSMRSLNTSLPGTSPPKAQAPEPPEQLLQAFKSAALAVTTLYKTAAIDQSRARTEGYQDALDELLAFLDSEDMGLSDGEGWRIRRWATERLDGREATAQPADSDDEPEKPERGSSPVLQRVQSTTQTSTRLDSPSRAEPSPLSLPSPTNELPPTMLPPTGAFTFRAAHPYPLDSEMVFTEPEPSDGRRQSVESLSSHNTHTPSSITITRPRGSAARHTPQNRHAMRTAGTMGRTSVVKRKFNVNFGELFDVDNLGQGKEGYGGGGAKRGRFV